MANGYPCCEHCTHPQDGRTVHTIRCGICKQTHKDWGKERKDKGKDKKKEK